MRIAFVVLFCFFQSLPATAQSARSIQSSGAAVTMDRYAGTSVATDLGYGIKLNKGSSLKREWFVVRDADAPASVEGDAGVMVNFKAGERTSVSQYQYTFGYQVSAKEPITAFELRVHVLDIFGRLLKTLSATEIVDQPIGKMGFVGTWRIWSENEASEAFASVVYIAKVRTAGGRVYEVDRAAVLDQVRKVSKRITEADLEPSRGGPPK